MKQWVMSIGLALCVMSAIGCSASHSSEPVLIEPGYSYLRHEPRVAPLSATGPVSFDDRGAKRFE